MTVARSDIIRGPAIVQFGGATIYSQGDITARPVKSINPVMTSKDGEVAHIIDSILWQVQFTPSGQWVAGHLTVLWPSAICNPTKGSSIFGASDTDLVIHSISGQKLTLKAGAVVSPSELTLSAGASVIGQVTLEAIGADDTAWTNSSKFAELAAEAFSDTSFDPDAIKVVPYSVAWGSASPWNAIETEAGVRVSFNVSLREERTDTYGIVDKTMQTVGVQARFIPVGISETQFISKSEIQGAGIQRGKNIRNTDNLVIDGSAGNPKVTVYQASWTDGSLVWGEPKRVGEVVLQAVRKFTAGVAQPLVAVAVGT